MPGIATSVAVIQNEKILLTKRDDFEIWCLPGGGVKPGESLAQGAIREVYEETGLEVRLEELVGVYSKLGYMNDVHSTLFTAKVIGGELRVRPGETIELRFFRSNELPKEIVFGHSRRVLDALRGVRGVARMQKLESSIEVAKTRQELYALRDKSDLSRGEFYLDLIDRLGPELEELEVG